MTETLNALIGTWQDAYAERARLHVGKEDGNGNSSLSVLVEYRLVSTGQPMKKYHCIIKKDGTFCQRKDGTTERAILERRYGWDLSDPDFSAESMNPEHIVRVKIEGETYREQTRAVIGFVADKDGEGSSDEKPDPKAISAKFGQMLRATAQKINRPASKPAAPSASPTAPAKKAPPPKPSGVSNQQECWELFCRVSKEDDESKRTANWFALLESVNGAELSQDDYDAQAWFNVACEIRKHMGKDEIPF